MTSLELNRENLKNLEIITEAAAGFQEYIEGIILSVPNSTKVPPARIPTAIKELNKSIERAAQLK